MPAWQEIDTPWPAQEIAWRRGNSVERKAELKRQVAQIDLTHIVREVLLHGPNVELSRAFTREEAEAALPHAKAELARFQQNGLAVADTEWHITSHPTQSLIVLARVAIIDADPAPIPSEALAAWHQSRDVYAASGHYQEWVVEGQTLYGKPRANPDAPSAITLIDIEPMRWTDTGQYYK